MKFKYYAPFKFGEKEFRIYENEQKERFLCKKCPTKLYKTLRKISDIASESDYLLDIVAFHKNTSNELLYFMPFIDGITLLDMIETKKQLTKEEINNIIYQICEGLNQLHRENILHRDIKPANIMLKNKQEVIIVDYGISRLYDKEKDSDTTKIGTRGYAAPEQFGFSQTSIESDIYALGKTIEELVENCFIEQKYIFNPIIDKSCSFDPKNRFKSTKEIIKIIYENELELSKDQLIQVKKGQKLGLSAKQIKQYAKQEFNAKQMGVLKHALNENISENIFNLMADSNFDSKQMWQIKRGALDGLDIEMIKQYAKESYRAHEMGIYRAGILLEKNKQTILDNIKAYEQFEIKSDFSIEQLSLIRKGFYHGLDYKYVEVYAHDFISFNKMQKIMNILLEESNE